MVTTFMGLTSSRDVTVSGHGINVGWVPSNRFLGRIRTLRLPEVERDSSVVEDVQYRVEERAGSAMNVLQMAPRQIAVLPFELVGPILWGAVPAP
jgi:hypothetical protein